MYCLTELNKKKKIINKKRTYFLVHVNVFYPKSYVYMSMFKLDQVYIHVYMDCVIFRTRVMQFIDHKGPILAINISDHDITFLP